MLNLLGAALSQDVIWFIALGALIIVIAIVVAIVPVKVWFRCLVSGAHVGMGRLIGMRMRGVNTKLITESYISAKKAGLNLSIAELETHYMAGGNVDKVVWALISAHSAKLSLSTELAKAIDLAGRDVQKAVEESVTPRVIMTNEISAVAKNGIELKVTARVTVRTNLERLIGGAGEQTIISRVGEGIVTTVGSAETHEQVLQNPDAISAVIQEKGLDDGTAFQIISVDIADIDVGRNIGADLQTFRAEADKIIAQAKAEERKAEAIALEHEMRAMSESMRSKLLEAESNVPKALAEAFKDGKIGVMDYYKMQNLISDTTMRNALGGKQDNTVTPKSLPDSSSSTSRRPSKKS
ncbi:MAG: flotillin-like protein FloA [Spirochaetales bacterium]